MPDSPFAPEDLGVESIDAGPPPMADDSGLKRQRLNALLAALGSIAMFTPVGKTAKGAAAALAGTGALNLATGLAEAQGKPKSPAGAEDSARIKIASPGAKKALTTGSLQEPVPGSPAGDPGIQDEYTDQHRSLTQQLQAWQQKLTTGAPKAETQDKVNELNRQLKEINDARATRANQATADKTAKEKSDTDARKAADAEELRNRYRIGGGATGLGLGALVGLLSRGRLTGAVKSFEQTAGDIGNLTKQPGNLLVSKGNAAPELQAGVNAAYNRGGASSPLPSMAGIYGSESQAGLRQAKRDFRATNESVPTSAPFAPEAVKEMTKLHPVVEKGIPLALGGEAAATYGASYATDNPDTKDTLRNAAWGGGTALAGYGLTRKLSQAFTNKRPTELATRAVNAGRERLQKDAQTVGLKDLKTYASQTGDVAVSRLPKALPKKTEFKPGDAAEMWALNEHKNTTVKGARQGFVQDAMGKDEVVSAYQASIDPATKQVNRDAFRKALRQRFSGGIDHQGQRVKVDDSLVREILKSLGAMGR